MKMFDAGKTRTMVRCDDMLSRFHLVTEHIDLLYQYVMLFDK